MKTVIAKFKCTSIKEYEGGGKEFELSAVMGDTPENKGFNDYTPSGSLRFMVAPGKPAAEYFTPGGEYHIEFSKA